MPNNGYTLAVQKWLATLPGGTVITMTDAANATGLTRVQAGGALSHLATRAKTRVQRVEGSRGVYRTAETRTAVRKPVQKEVESVAPAQVADPYLLLRRLHSLNSTETLALDEVAGKVYKLSEI